MGRGSPVFARISQQLGVLVVGWIGVEVVALQLVAQVEEACVRQAGQVNVAGAWHRFSGSLHGGLRQLHHLRAVGVHGLRE